MIIKVLGSTISGCQPHLVSTEIGIQKGLPKFEIVGLGQSAVKEGRDRIMTAIKTSGFLMDSKRIIVNLAPASLKKDGSSLDLPIALGILVGTEFLLPEKLPQNTMVIGEVSLDGSIRPVRGVFAMVQELQSLGIKKFILPMENTQECDLFNDLEILPAQTLRQVVDCLQGLMPWPDKKSSARNSHTMDQDWSDVKGQVLAKRALEIAAAGGHHALMAGVPGVGKTLLARRFHTILPDLTIEQEQEVRKIQSIDGVASNAPHRPFRMPHHHASLAGMMGGGKNFRMGEFSLAHHGVLFMDEFPEFRRDIVEALREPLEEGVVRVSRAEGTFLCPAKFQLIAAMNLCPCGALGDEKKTCICTPWHIQKYRNKLSKPIQDRLDLLVELKGSHWRILWEEKEGETSSQVRSRVVRARQKQQERYGNENFHNSNIPSKVFIPLAQLDLKTQEMLESFIKKQGISLRALEKTLRVSRTIADLEDKADIGFEHVCEALQYRMSFSI